MSYLFLSLIGLLLLYSSCVLIVMKRTISWRYKALIYGAFTFLMLIGAFLIFAHYDTSWKESRDIRNELPQGDVNNDRGS